MKTSLLLLICKITLKGPAPCVPSSTQTCGRGGGYPIFLDTPSSGPHYKSPFGGPWGLPAYTPLQVHYKGNVPFDKENA